MFSFLWKSQPKPTSPKKAEKHKYFWQSDFGPNSPHYQWLVDRTFLQEGFTRIFFNKFDFTQKNRFFEIISVLHERFVFVNCTFTQDQIEKMLLNDFDLSRCTYTLDRPVSFSKYIELYQFCENNNIKNRLGGLPVDCGNIDFHDDPREDIVGACYPTNLSGSILSTEQLNFLVLNRSGIRPLNLSGLIPEDLDISGLIKNAHSFLSFSPFDADAQGTIFVTNALIQNAALNMEALAICATDSKYLAFFNQNALKFKIRFENDIDGFRDRDIDISVDDFIKKLELPIATPRVCQPSNFDLLKQAIKTHRPNLPDLDFSTMENGEKLLWAFYCAHHLPEGNAAKPVWRALGINRKYSGMKSLKNLADPTPIHFGM